VHDEFVRWFDASIAHDADYYREIGADIWRLWAPTPNVARGPKKSNPNATNWFANRLFGDEPEQSSDGQQHERNPAHCRA
jgi:hypothetical protein